MINRDNSPDAIKGMCILLMVFGHVSYIGSFTSSLYTVKAFIYTFHMPLFLILSGYFFSFNANIQNSALKILKRIALPYLIFIFLYLVGLILVQYLGIKTTNVAPKTISEFFRIIFLNPIGGYWFLHSLIVIQLSILFSRYVTARFSSDTKSIAIALLISIFILLIMTKFGVITFRTVTYFILGIIVKQLYPDGFSFPFKLSLLLVVLFYLGNTFWLIDIYNLFSASEVIWCLLLTSFFWSLFIIFKDNYVTNLMAYLGRNTLIILVLHALFIVAMKPLNNLFLVLDATGIMQSLIVTVITLVLCLFSARVFDYLNITRFIFNVENIYSKQDRTG